jgi:PKD repeat protein
MFRTTRIHAPLLLAALIAVLVAGCGLDKQEIPSLAGPSEFGLSISMTATPNQLPRDGSSQSVITIRARDASGNPIAGQRLRLTLPANAPSGATLSRTEVTTDAAGQASVAVTAPNQTSIGNTILVTVVPVGENLDNAASRQISIAVSPTNTTRPTPSFTFNPANPDVGQLVQFNASATTDEGVACTDTCTYTWDFGGEATATGRIVSYRFQRAGPYLVALTVTDAQGASETTRTTVTVAGLALPSVTISPTTATAGRQTTFTATATVAPNHRIVRYEWSWGDGSSNTTTTSSNQHTYSAPGSYLLRVTVTDDLGQSSTGTQVVTVTSGLVANFSNEAAIAGETTTFDGSGSFSESSTIVLYTWRWGDGSVDQSTENKTIEHTFAVAGDYGVRLTVTDNQGRTAMVTRTITVSPAP